MALLRALTWLGFHGWGLLLPVGCLCVMGVLSLQATGRDEAVGRIAPDAIKQLEFMGIGVLCMIATCVIGYRRLGRFAAPLFLLGLGLLVWLLLDKWIDMPLVEERRGSRRWFFLPGFQVQPSEIMKILYVLAVAWYLRFRRNYRQLTGLLAPFVLTLIPMALILVQPDLGTVLLFLPVLFAMLFAAGAKIRHLVVVILLGLMCMPVFWLKIRTYQRLRITAVFLQSQGLRDHFISKPQRWDQLRPKAVNSMEWRRELMTWENRTGYQLTHSKAAIGTGGLWGQGWGQGIFLDNHLLPENNNDFIFAIIAHQWGLAGSILVIACYALIVAMGYDISTWSVDPYGRLLALGLSTLLAVQVLTNLCMTVGLGPITGVTLPFLSAGGSSVLVCFSMIGLLISVARDKQMRIGRKPFSFDEETGEFIDVPQIANR